MKKEIHPTYFDQAKISCACGAVYEIGSTREDIQVEICAKCHPFYTGEQKIMDTARRVEKFHSRTAKKSASVVSKKIKQAKRAVAKKAKKTTSEK